MGGSKVASHAQRTGKLYSTLEMHGDNANHYATMLALTKFSLGVVQIIAFALDTLIASRQTLAWLKNLDSASCFRLSVK